MRTLLICFSVVVFVDCSPLAAQDILLSRVVDVGAGLCVVTISPAEPRSAIMVYDANSGCDEEIDGIVVGDTIDLMVISHSDADHLMDADDILRDRPVKLILRTGSRRTGSGSTNYGRMEDRIGDETQEDRATVINLATFPLEPGTKFALGDATVTFVAGWPEWTLTDGLDEGESNNAVSIVVRMDYDGRSILLGGDTVGRHIDDPADTCDHAEKAMVDGPISLAADVLVAPHHGGTTGVRVAS